MNSKTLSIGIYLSVFGFCFLSSSNLHGQYETVQIDELKWMTTNLGFTLYGDEGSTRAIADLPIDYGVFYTYEAAERACYSLGTGWRLPNQEDWENLFSAFELEKDSDGFGGYEISDEELRRLTDYGLDGLKIPLTGTFRDGSSYDNPGMHYSDQDQSGFYWVDSEDNNWKANTIRISRGSYDDVSIEVASTSRSSTLGSCRCVKDSGFGTILSAPYGLSTYLGHFKNKQLLLADHNGDGKNDLYVMDNENGRFMILDGADGFKSYRRGWTKTYLNHFKGIPLMLGDYNGDGKPDLYAAMRHDGRVIVLDGAKNFTTYRRGYTKSYLSNFNGKKLLLADYNGDGKPDLYVANPGDGRVIFLDGKSNFQSYFRGWTYTALSNFKDKQLLIHKSSRGKPDLYVFDQNNGRIDILDGDKKFQESIGKSSRTFLLSHENRNLVLSTSRPFDLAIPDIHNGGMIFIGGNHKKY